MFPIEFVSWELASEVAFPEHSKLQQIRATQPKESQTRVNCRHMFACEALSFASVGSLPCARLCDRRHEFSPFPSHPKDLTLSAKGTKGREERLCCPNRDSNPQRLYPEEWNPPEHDRTFLYRSIAKVYVVDNPYCTIYTILRSLAAIVFVLIIRSFVSHWSPLTSMLSTLHFPRF